jgi:hypothetical protein
MIGYGVDGDDARCFVKFQLARAIHMRAVDQLAVLFVLRKIRRRVNHPTDPDVPFSVDGVLVTAFEDGLRASLKPLRHPCSSAGDFFCTRKSHETEGLQGSTPSPKLSFISKRGPVPSTTMIG